MDPKASAARPSFSKILRSFQGGTTSLEAVLAHIDEELAAGSAASDMRGVLRLSEFIEPLPPAALDAINKRFIQRTRAPDAETFYLSDADDTRPLAHVPTPPPASPLAAPPPPPLPLPIPVTEPSVPTPPAIETPATVEMPLPASMLSPVDEMIPEVPDEPDRLSEPVQPASLVPATPAAPAIPATPETASVVGIGTVLHERFRLLELIGESAVSKVYKATDLLQIDDRLPDRSIAIKVLTRPFLDSAEAFHALQQYVGKLARLDHPNIVRVLDCDRAGTTVFMTMEYLAGETLRGKLRAASRAEGDHPALESNAAQSMITGVGKGLAFAHQNQVVHGNVRPDNVIVSDNQTVKLVDFEIVNWVARPITDLERNEAAGNRMVSAVTPQYASPQLIARQKPEVTDDVYALACLAYEALTGWHPFDDGTGAQTSQFPPPHRPGLRSSQYAAVVNALHPERRGRTQSVRQFLDEFEAADRDAESRKWLPWAGAAVVALVLGGLYWQFRTHDNQPTALAPTVVTPPASEPLPAQVPQVPQVAPVAPAPAVATAPKPGSILRDCPTCIQMTVLPVGQFVQGAAAADSAAGTFEKPAHKVSIGYGLAMSTNSVTVEEFQEFAGSTGRNLMGCDTYDGKWAHQAKANWQEPGFEQSPQSPVTCVSYADAVAYAAWLSVKNGHAYRLPTASEWEYAARAGTTAAVPWGSNGADACQYANVADAAAARRYPGWDVFTCDDGHAYTAPVGSFLANGFGLNDMLGNVFVWTEDCWHGTYVGAPTDGSARKNGDCGQHELRGGSWFSSPRYVTVSYRNHFPANYRTSSVGIRLVREL